MPKLRIRSAARRPDRVPRHPLPTCKSEFLVDVAKRIQIGRIKHSLPRSPALWIRAAFLTWSQPPMHIFTLAFRLLLPLAGTATLALAQQQPASAPTPPQMTPALFPAGYANHETLSNTVQGILKRFPNHLRVRSLGKSIEGRDLWMASLGRPEAENQAKRPAILIVANLEADHLVGSQVALGLIERLAAAAAEANPEVTGILDRLTIHIVPRLNPDGAERMLANRPGVDHRLSLQALDRDRDGRKSEDGPDDLDGDGWALTMRVRDLKASWIVDPTDARILRKADPNKGEQASYSLYTEGRDEDGDGNINEDPPGGVNLNRNWPHRWPEFDAEAGWSPGFEPETRPLIRFLTEHPEITVVWTFSLNDTLRAEPKKPGSTLDDADVPLFAELSRRYNVALGEAAKTAPPLLNVPGPPAPAAASAGPIPLKPLAANAAVADFPIETGQEGALSEWAYQQLGAVAFATRVWAGPELPAPAEGQPAQPADGEARWMFWNDQVVGGQAFVPFHPFEHPTLGPVELGGWKPGVRVNPSADRLPTLVDGHFLFLKNLTTLLPSLELGEVTVQNRGDGLFEISTVLSNPGYLPTHLQQSIRTGESLPVVVKLNAPRGLLLSGQPLVKIDRLAGSGGNRSLKWLIQAPADLKAVEIEATSPRAGLVRKSVPLR